MSAQRDFLHLDHAFGPVRDVQLILCLRCQRLELVVYDQRKRVARVYYDDTPVLHK